MPKRHPALGSKSKPRGLAWDDISRVTRERAPLCVLCLAGGTPTAAVCVDHITPISRGGTNEPSNLQALCGDCHARKTAGENAKGAGHFQRLITIELTPPVLRSAASAAISERAGLTTYDEAFTLFHLIGLGYWSAQSAVKAVREALYLHFKSGAVDSDLLIKTSDIQWAKTIGKQHTLRVSDISIDDARLIGCLIDVCYSSKQREAWLSDWRRDLTRYYATLII